MPDAGALLTGAATPLKQLVPRAIFFHLSCD